MSKKKSVYKDIRVISDVAINSVVRFPKRSGLYKVIFISDVIVFLEKVEKNSQIFFTSPLCVVRVVEGF